MRLLIFNPETEYALASGASFYTPPARVEQLRRKSQLLPEAWAESSDFILVDDPDSLHSDFRLVDWKGLDALFARYPDLVIDPWGWNSALVRRLKDAGVPSDRLPDDDAMLLIRSLAHRRTTVTLNALWNQRMSNLHFPGSVTPIPVELPSLEDCMDFFRANPGCWFKAPWSSSGRGVINTGADMTPDLVGQWCRGILRRQGSVMGETPADRIADFATEWKMEKGRAIFLCISCFNTTRRGKYISNDFVSQREMKDRFNALTRLNIEKVIDTQKEILEIVLSGYEGPCGVDMLVERNGGLRPFVELNLRRTMGMLHGLRPS